MDRGDVISTIKRYGWLHRAARRTRFSIGHVMPPRRFDGIPGRIHFNDFMFGSSSTEEISSYAERARNVIALIEETLTAAGKTLEDIERWLDFGCGYGRVIRFLAQRVPPDRIFASDVIEEGVDFCHSEFGVAALHSQPDLTSVQLGCFDFIYAISVITHLNESNSLAFLRLVGDALSDGGIAMFTTHGQWSIEHAGMYGPDYKARVDEIEAVVRERGIAYFRYPFEERDYGITWHSRGYIEDKMAELHGYQVLPVLFKPHGLDDHQDVFAFQRVAHKRLTCGPLERQLP